MKNVKLAVFDVDGTLIPDDPHTMTAYCTSILNQLKQNGVLLGIASGRDAYQAEDMTKDYGVKFDLFIGLNGAEILDTRTNSYKNYCGLTAQAKKEIIETMMTKYPNLNPATYCNGIRISLRNETVRFGNHNVKMMGDIAKDISDFWQQDGGKLMFRLDENVIDEVFEYAKTLPSKDYYVTKTQTTMLEFNHIDAQKGVALKRFCKDNNIDLKDVASFGDMINDNDMIEVSGIGVAVSNADESTKKVAKYITELDNNHDAVAHFIQDNFLVK